MNTRGGSLSRRTWDASNAILARVCHGAAQAYYANTTETAKARRLATHLLHDNLYRGQQLFDITGFPSAKAIPQRELAHLVNEESIPL